MIPSWGEPIMSLLPKRMEISLDGSCLCVGVCCCMHCIPVAVEQQSEDSTSAVSEGGEEDGAAYATQTWLSSSLTPLISSVAAAMVSRKSEKAFQDVCDFDPTGFENEEWCTTGGTPDCASPVKQASFGANTWGGYSGVRPCRASATIWASHRASQAQ
ncbi:unnamed protein product [Polarella glacialis]|uniref:Uncharacterized protein n=2 Tax=Polarella glacialis TaxID=89957 RepID=A0A813HYC9_POLGL|nr:unnamed protein product [Polarella glacialis]